MSVLCASPCVCSLPQRDFREEIRVFWADQGHLGKHRKRLSSVSEFVSEGIQLERSLREWVICKVSLFGDMAASPPLPG